MYSGGKIDRPHAACRWGLKVSMRNKGDSRTPTWVAERGIREGDS